MSIEALNWARKIRVGDSLAKSLLRAIADYADENGHCFPSPRRLADDCELSEDTVKRRIRQLEELGLLVTFRCWCDDNGKRNQEQRGRETSKEIRLALQKRSITPIETDGSSEPQDVEFGGADSPPSNSDEGVLTAPPVPPTAPPGDALVHPPSEPSLKQDSPPNPPPGGSDQKSDQEENKPEPEHFAAFFESCQHWRTMDRQRALMAFGFLTPDERGKARAASPLHAEECTKAKRRSKDAHKLLAERFWERYPNARLPEKPSDLVWIDEGPDIDALRVLSQVMGHPQPRLIHDDVKGSGMLRKAPLGEDLKAISRFVGSDILDWFIAEPDTSEFNAWRHRIHEWTGNWTEPRIVMRRGTRLMKGALGVADFEAQNRQNGIPVPCRWPPRKDGTILPESNEGER